MKKSSQDQCKDLPRPWEATDSTFFGTRVQKLDKQNFPFVGMEIKEMRKNFKTNQRIPTVHEKQPTPPFITADLDQPQGLKAYFDNISQHAQGKS